MNYVFKAGASVVKVNDEEIAINFPPKKFKINELTGASWKAGNIGNGKFTLVAGNKTIAFYFNKKQNKEAEEFFNFIAPIINNKMQDEASSEQVAFWEAFNNLPCKDTFGTKKEVGYLATIIQQGEELKALTSGLMDGNTWLIACTNKRVIFLDNGLLYGLEQMEIPLRSINSINQKLGLLLGEIHIQDGASSIKIENVSKETIPFFVKNVNDQLNLHHNGNQTASPKPISNLDEIKKLKELLDIGALTQEEFDLKKKQLLGI